LKILVIAAHADDGHVAVGGTISRLIEEKVRIFYIVFSLAEESVPEGFPKDILEKECKESSKYLGIKEKDIIIYKYPVRRLTEHRQEILDKLIDVKNQIQPNIIFAPSTCDIHQDHEVVSAESIRAFRKDTNIYGYDFPWNILYEGKLNLFYELSEKHINNKVKALSFYESQLVKHYNCLNENYIKALAIERGHRIGKEYAEAFETIREIRGR
jgi:LmbE family N-acetylglucosaminyl deacetylase